MEEGEEVGRLGRGGGVESWGEEEWEEESVD